MCNSLRAFGAISIVSWNHPFELAERCEIDSDLVIEGIIFLLIRSHTTYLVFPVLKLEKRIDCSFTAVLWCALYVVDGFCSRMCLFTDR